MSEDSERVDYLLGLHEPDDNRVYVAWKMWIEKHAKTCTLRDCADAITTGHSFEAGVKFGIHLETTQAIKTIKDTFNQHV